MASNPPGKCCTIGVKHEGEATGQIQKIGGYDTYIAQPPSKDPSHAILILTDIFGLELINNKLLADHFAANGYLAVMPDLFEGDAIKTEDFGKIDIMKWLTTSGPSKGHLPQQTDPIIEAVIKELHASFGVKKIGATGYCFGAKYVARFAAAGKGVDVAYMAHPSFVDVEEVKAIAGPLSIAAAETDPVFPAEKRRETEDVLKEMTIPYQITLYSGVEHGFAVRADMSKPAVKFAKEAAFVQAVAWFDEFLKGNRTWAA